MVFEGYNSGVYVVFESLVWVLYGIIVLFWHLIVTFSFSCFNFSVIKHFMKIFIISRVIEIKEPS